MKIATYLLACALLLFGSSCGKNCDTLTFIDPHELVEKDILAMDSLLRVVNHQCQVEYVIDFDKDPIEIQVRDEKERTLLVTWEYFCDAATFPRKKFYALAAGLKRNEIRYVYRDVATGINVFGYCYTDYAEGSLLRHIIIDEKDNQDMCCFDSKVMDKKGKLVLMALRDRD